MDSGQSRAGPHGGHPPRAAQGSAPAAWGAVNGPPAWPCMKRVDTLAGYITWRPHEGSLGVGELHDTSCVGLSVYCYARAFERRIDSATQGS